MAVAMPGISLGSDVFNVAGLLNGSFVVIVIIDVREEPDMKTLGYRINWIPR
jgi:hypothetical protein